MKTIGAWLRASMTMCAVGLLVAGCEDDGSDLTGSEFSISPSSTTMTADDETVTLQALGGEEPMTWSVSDESLGTVAGSGRTVVYTRKSVQGVNIVKVVDAKTWEASATITQTTTDDELAVSPASATLAKNDSQITFTASGGNPGYSWSVGNTSKGHIVGTDNNTSVIVYERDQAGDNTVICKDQDGTVVVVAVSQPSDTGLTVSASPSTLSSNGSVALLTASGGTEPYSWSLSSSTAGSLASTSGKVVTYTRNSAGSNVATVTDDHGNVASVIINQP